MENSNNTNFDPLITESDYIGSIDLARAICKNTDENFKKLLEFLEINSIYSVSKNTIKSDGKREVGNIVDLYKSQSYNFPREKYLEFLLKLDLCRNPKLFLNFCERQEDTSGIFLDFDLKVYKNESIFTAEIIEELVYLIHEKIAASLEKIEDIYHIFVFKRSELSKEVRDDIALYKDGLHVLIPEIHIEKRLKHYIFTEIAECLPDLFQKYAGQIDSQNLADILDEGSRRVPVLLYNCVQPKSNKRPYVLGAAFKIKSIRRTYNFENITSRIDAAIAEGRFRPTLELSLSYMPEPDEKPDGKELLLQRKVCRPCAEVRDKLKEIEDNIREKQDISSFAADPIAAELSKLLKILDQRYADDYNLWFNVLCAIHNTNPAYRELARTFSMRSAKYNEQYFNEKWDNVAESAGRGPFNPITMNSIYYWAKKSNEEAYRGVTNESFRQKLRIMVYESAGDLTHSQIADLLFYIFGRYYVTDVEDTKSERIWYKFVLSGDRDAQKAEVFKWKKLGREMPKELINYIRKDFSEIVSRLISNMKISQEKDNDEDAEKLKKKIKGKDIIIDNLEKIRKKSGDMTFCKNVLSMCKVIFSRSGFIEKLDTNPYLMGVGNGVLKIPTTEEAKRGEMPQLITTYHEYPVSKYTETNYIPYDTENPHIADVEDFLNKIIIEEDAREYIKYYYAQCIRGINPSPIILQLYGGGNNGKTSLLELIARALGKNYAASLPKNLLTASTEKAESPNSAFMRIKDKRFVRYSEFEPGETLHTSRLKSLTSQDSLSGRELNAAQTEFYNTAVHTLCGNSKVRISQKAQGHAIWKRLRLYCMKMKFVENPNPEDPLQAKENSKYEYEFLGDANKKAAILSILVKYYIALCINHDGNFKNVKSATVEKETQDHRNNQDDIQKFIHSMLVKIEDQSVRYSLMELKSAYSNWYSDVMGTYKKDFTLLDFEEMMQNSSIATALVYKGEKTYVAGYFLKRNRGVLTKDVLNEEIRLKKEEARTEYE